MGKAPFGARHPVVLLVDRDQDTGEMYRVALPDWGLTVRAVCNGHDALRAASELKPDIIVTDISLPDMAGCDLIQRLRLQVGLGAVPVLVLTAWAGKPYERCARDTGCVGVLWKPCLPDTLAENVMQALLAGASSSEPQEHVSDSPPGGWLAVRVTPLRTPGTSLSAAPGGDIPQG